MIRATTPTHVFTFPDDPTQWDAILITYKQDFIVLEKTKEDLVFDGNTASYTLTQEEANMFRANELIRIQVRVALNDGTAFASQIVIVHVDDVLNDEVLP